MCPLFILAVPIDISGYGDIWSITPAAAPGNRWVYIERVMAMDEWRRCRLTTRGATPSWIMRDAMECRRPWTVICFTPARAVCSFITRRRVEQDTRRQGKSRGAVRGAPDTSSTSRLVSQAGRATDCRDPGVLVAPSIPPAVMDAWTISDDRATSSTWSPMARSS